YSGDALLQQVSRILRALGPETSLYYSAKANPSLGVCQLLARQGVGVEVASIGELALAKAAGFPADSTLFAGPGKTDDELMEAVRRGLFAVNVESEGELERLAEIAQLTGQVVRVALRVNPALPVQ